jgi:hypothetical protein
MDLGLYYVAALDSLAGRCVKNGATLGLRSGRGVSAGLDLDSDGGILIPIGGDPAGGDPAGGDPVGGDLVGDPDMVDMMDAMDMMDMMDIE